MYHKVYFGNKPLFLTDELTKEVEPYIHHDDAVFIDELDGHTIKSMIHEMERPEVHAGVFLNTDLDILLHEFKKKFNVIIAAGGLVRKENNSESLMIFRRGFWDLPKGKLDKGEKTNDAAIREVMEETGLKNLKMEKFLVTTYHTYHEGTKFILKESHWYLMTASGEQDLVPQTEEDITDIRWVKDADMDEYLEGAYPLIRDVWARV